MSAIVTRKYPWLKLGNKQQIQHVDNYELALKEMGLDFEVHKEDIFTSNGLLVPDAQAVVRDDGTIICSTGKSTTLVQNREKFGFFEDMLQTGLVELAGGGILKNGNKQFLLARYKEPYIVAEGDEIEHFVLCRDAHDNSGSVSLNDFAGRLICSNGLARIYTDEMIKFRHSSKVQSNVLRFREMLEKTKHNFTQTLEAYKSLANKKVNDIWLKEYIMKVLGINDEDKVMNDNGEPIKNIRDILEATHAGDGQNLQSIHGTAWWAYNGVTNWLSHTRGRSVDTRLESLFWGDGLKRNQLALETALTLAV